MPPEIHIHNGGFRLGAAPSRLMLVTGVLAVDETGCVYSAVYGGVGILWPDDYSVRTGAGGAAEIIDADGGLVLREGERFQAGGGFGDGHLPGDCAVRHPEYVVIESQLRRLEPS